MKHIASGLPHAESLKKLQEKDTEECSMISKGGFLRCPLRMIFNGAKISQTSVQTLVIGWLMTRDSVHGYMKIKSLFCGSQEFPVPVRVYRSNHSKNF
jgi:hypothetical protein